MSDVQHQNGTAKKPATKVEKKSASRRSAFDDSTKITILAKENPRKPGSELHADWERMKKTKTVGDYYAKGGRTGILRHCIEKKWIKVS